MSMEGMREAPFVIDTRSEQQLWLVNYHNEWLAAAKCVGVKTSRRAFRTCNLAQ